MNNQMPGMRPGGFMPFNPNPNFPAPNFPGQNQGCMCQDQVNSLDNRVNRLERQVKRLERRLMENQGGMIQPRPIPYNEQQDYGQNNQGMYMI